ncbi:MAG: hypothetical protein KC443_05345 [Anaerolineales bacterium]|nr:hypothetical protein [Anaerolineales bacterium]
MKRWLTTLGFLLLGLVLGVLANQLLAQGDELSANPDAPVVAMDGSFTYQGELQDGNTLIDNVCDFQLSLWDAANGGAQVGSTQTSGGVVVSNGRFAILLNNLNQFGSNPFSGDARWLEIAVRCPSGSGTYTMLTPRQALTAAPYAHGLRPGAVISGLVSGGGAGLRVVNTMTSGGNHGIVGETEAGGGRGVFGYASANSGATVGVYGQADSASGSGVVGVSDAYSGSGYTAGVVGVSNTNAGVIGYSNGSTVPAIAGYHGGNGPAIYGSGGGAYAAVEGLRSDDGTAVAGYSSGGTGVYGYGGNTPGGYGGYFIHEGGGYGLYAQGNLNDSIRVGASNDDGIQVSDGIDYPNYGVYVPSPGVPETALLVQTAEVNGEWALSTQDKIQAANVTFQSLTLLAQVDGADALSAGDVVAVSGIATPLPDSHEQMPLVRLADASTWTGVVGVVETRMLYQVAPGKEVEGEMIWHSADGPAQPGDYVSLTIYGVAQVKVGETAVSSITSGQRLTAAETPGYARALRTETINGMVISEGAPVIGIALDSPDPATGLVPILVTLR